MKNAINYFYHLNPDNIHKNNNLIYFMDNGYYYVFRVFNEDVSILNMVSDISSKMYQNGIYIHQIIANINGEYITNIDGINYVLVRSKDAMERTITINDIIEFHEKVKYIDVSHEKINWSDLWSKKIDYFEYQVNQFGIKYPIIRKSFNYFIGMAENGISAYNDYGLEYTKYFIVHKRLLTSSKLYDLYDPFNLIYDVKSRDFSEYIKNYFFSNNENNDAFLVFENNIGLFNFNSYELLLFYIRLLYPSFYFDVYEKIVENGEEESKLDIIIDNIEKYEIFLKEITLFLEKYITLPNIEWIKKVVKLN